MTKAIEYVRSYFNEFLFTGLCLIGFILGTVYLNSIAPEDVDRDIRKEVAELRIELKDDLEVKPKDIKTDLQYEFANMHRKIDALFNKHQDLIYILEEVGFGIVKVDRDHSIIGWNKNAEDIFGYCASDAYQLTVEDLMAEQFREIHFERFDRSFNGKRETHAHGLTCKLAKNKDGELFEITLILAVPKDKDYAIALFWPASIITIPDIMQ